MDTFTVPSEGETRRVRPRGVRRWVRLMVGSRQAMLGIVLAVPILAIALLAPVLNLPDPTSQDLMNTLSPPVWHAQGDAGNLLGTDHLGRDILSRIVWGARVSLFAAFGAALVAAFLGVVLGLLAGYYGGRLDNIVMRLVDIQLAFPLMLLALAIIAVLGPSIRNLVIVMALTSWVMHARLVRGITLSLRNREFIDAARALGSRDVRTIFMHVLPNVFSTVVVMFTLEVARMLLLESALSFLGLGIPPPAPTWGRMLADGRNYLTAAYWMATFPGLAIMLSVLSINMLGDGLRDVLDSRL